MAFNEPERTISAAQSDFFPFLCEKNDQWSYATGCPDPEDILHSFFTNFK